MGPVPPCIRPQLSAPLDGNQNRTGEILGVCIGFLVISVIFVLLRLYTRIFLIKSARWDDWTIVLALLGSFIGAALVFPEVHYGFGRHECYLTEYQLKEFTKYTFGEWIQTFFTLMATKVSICLLLLRISPSRYIIRPIQGLVAFLVLTNIVLSLVWIFQCNPVDGAWDDSKRKPDKCYTRGQIQRVIISQAIISIISDFILAAFPIIILRNVRISFRQKILLCGLMGLGILTAACCIVRTVMNWQNAHDDPTWVSVANFVWRTAEVNIGIIAACLPTLLPFYRLLRDKHIALRARLASTDARFPRFLFHRSHEIELSSQRPIRESHREDGIAIPQNAQWRNPSFSRTGNSRGEDVETQTSFTKSY